MEDSKPVVWISHKELHPKAIELAVRARIRHEHTDYDERLLLEGDRGLARAEVRDVIDAVLDSWRAPLSP